MKEKIYFTRTKTCKKARKFIENGNHYGDHTVFRLNQNIKNSKKARGAESESSTASSIYFEGQFDSLNGCPYLEVENEDATHPMNDLDLNNNGKISRKEAKQF